MRSRCSTYKLIFYVDWFKWRSIIQNPTSQVENLLILSWKRTNTETKTTHSETLTILDVVHSKLFVLDFDINLFISIDDIHLFRICFSPNLHWTVFRWNKSVNNENKFGCKYFPAQLCCGKIHFVFILALSNNPFMWIFYLILATISNASHAIF